MDMAARAQQWRTARREPNGALARRRSRSGASRPGWLVADPGGELPVGDLSGCSNGPAGGRAGRAIRRSSWPVARPGRPSDPAAGARRPGPGVLRRPRRELVEAVRRAEADGDRPRVEVLEDEIEALNRRAEPDRRAARPRPHLLAVGPSGPVTAVRKRSTSALDAVEAGDPALADTLRALVRHRVRSVATPRPASRCPDRRRLERRRPRRPLQTARNRPRALRLAEETRAAPAERAPDEPWGIT